jgi:hypothetical protein
MNDIEQYLTKARGMNEFFAKELTKKIEKHDDIVKLFVEFIKTGTYSGEAENLHEKLPHLQPEAIFEFLVGLRDEPEKYAKYIAEGAPYL